MIPTSMDHLSSLDPKVEVAMVTRAEEVTAEVTTRAVTLDTRLLSSI